MFGEGASESAAMRLLANRIAKLRGQDAAKKAKIQRPALPTNVLMMDEVVAGEQGEIDDIGLTSVSCW